jgi:protoheme IX farnesyltransferase
MTTQLKTVSPTTGYSVLARLRMYWTLTKSLQTGLLLITGIAGYASARAPIRDPWLLLSLAASLFLAIGGSTVLNMVYDRDIDAKMQRACRRPLPSGKMPVPEALILGIITSATGIGWAIMMQPVYGAVVFAGWFFDVFVYTIWLKRRTPWSILWGGIAGAMPILAGRVLGTGQIDLIGILLALSVFLWIPTHMLTFGMKYAEQYKTAGVPVFPNSYGMWLTRVTLGLSTAAAVIAMLLAAWQIRMPWNYFHIALWLGGALFGIALLSVVRQSPKLNFALYKMASLYMLSSMILIMLGAA